MKKILFILLFPLSLSCLADTKVWDIAQMEVFIQLHNKKQKEYKKVRGNELMIKTQIELVKSQTKEIEGMQSEMFKSLCNFLEIAMSLMTMPFQVKEAEMICEQIFESQVKIHKNILKCPNIEALKYVSKKEEEICRKAVDLLKKLGPETIKDLLPVPGNLQNSRDIVKRFEYILSELRKIRTLSFALMRMTNIFNDTSVDNLNFGVIRFQIEREQIAKQIVEEQFKYIKR